MMAGNPNWWSIDSVRASSSAPHHFVAESSSVLPLNTSADNQQFPQSWSQLLLGGLAGEEDQRFGVSQYQTKKLEIWEDRSLNPSPNAFVVDGVKQEHSQISHFYPHHGDLEDQYQAASRPTTSWSPVLVSVVSPKFSTVTSLSTNMLDFSKNKAADGRKQHPDHSSECNSTAAGGVCKKPRVQSSSTQPPLKVRKERLGDRITALHQLVSPFGKTDTASVLLEAIGYIRFLQGQIEALSSPYLGNGRTQHSVQGERNCLFPEDPGQLLNDSSCLKRKPGAPYLQDAQDHPKDLRSRGLCLVPVSCTQQVGSDNGADYWAPPLGGGF